MLIGKALSMIETNLAVALTLTGMAQLPGVTPFHLARTFAQAAGQPVMCHSWRRRLTRAG